MPPSAKRKRERLHTGIEEFDFKGSVLYRPFLPDELIKPVTLNCPQAVQIGISTVIFSWRCAIQRHFETDRLVLFRGSQDEMKVACVKAIDDLPRGRLQYGTLLVHLPTPAKGPLIKRESRERSIGLAGILGDRLLRGKVLRPMVADIGFRRTVIRKIRC